MNAPLLLRFFVEQSITPIAVPVGRASEVLMGAA
jgi:hypothetical protein